MIDLTRTRTQNKIWDERSGDKEGDARGRKRGEGGREVNKLSKEEIFEAVQIPLLLRTAEFIAAWTEWIEHRLECTREYSAKWPITIQCFKLAIRKCERWGVERSVSAIEHSIEMCYRGLYEPRKFDNPSRPQKDDWRRFDPKTYKPGSCL